MRRTPFYQDLEAEATIITPEVENTISEAVAAAYKKAIANQSPREQNILNYTMPWWGWVISFLLPFLLIIYLIIKTPVTKRLSRQINQHLDIAQIHQRLWSQTKVPAPTKVTVSMRDTELEKFHYQTRSAYRVPADATIHQRSHVYYAPIFCGQVRYQNIVWVWYTYDDKNNRQVHYKAITSLWVDLTNESALLFTLKRHHFLGWNHQLAKVTLESEQFNKQFDLRANDQVKIRMVYTPYIMELTEKNDALLEQTSRSWSMRKTTNRFIVTYIPRSRSHLMLNPSLFGSNNQRNVTSSLTTRITTDFWQFYVAFRMVLITNYY